MTQQLLYIVTTLYALGDALFQDDYKKKRMFRTKLEKWFELLQKLDKDLDNVSFVMKRDNMVV